MLYCATLRVIRFMRRCLMGVITKTGILHHAVVCRVAALTLTISEIVGFFCPKVEASTFPLDGPLLGLGV